VTPMRHRVSIVMTALTAIVVALSLRASAQGQQPAAPATAAPARVVETAPRSAIPTPSDRITKSNPPTKSSKPHRVTVNGAVIDTMYGPVQVQVTVSNSRIVSADAINYPQGGGRDQEINSRAIPQLDQETMQAQSARIDTVSGATYTSDGYRRSLQSALDAAHRAA
jgi:uncharacterized protein with FMN-binding domain